MAGGGGSGAAQLNWYPGYYILARADNLDNILAYEKLAPFKGIHMRYFWSDSEVTPNDYSVGLTRLAADMAAAKQAGKKLLVFLNYEKSDGTPCVPPDLLQGPGAWCSGSFCGQFPNGTAPFPIYWNDAVAGRMRAWLAAMAALIEASADRDVVAGITLPETATGDYTLEELQAADYTTEKYFASVKATISSLREAAPSLIVFQYINGGFKPSPGEYFVKLADWALLNPGVGFGIPDLVPNNLNMSNADLVLRGAEYEGRLPRNPNVQAGDYALERTPSLAATLKLALAPAPDGMKASYVSFAFNPGPGPNAFTLDDAADAIPTNPTNEVMPTW